jgi:DNA-entry nuclease
MKKRSIMTISGAVVLLFVSLGLFTSPTENTKNNNSTKVVRTEKSSSSKKAGSSSKENSSKSSSESSKAESKTSSVATNAGVLSFTGQRQMQMGNLDSLRRATWSHIQLQDKDEPTVKRAPQLNYDPVGWHNFKFYYGDGTRQAWLMSRGHLVGYQFSGLNDEPRNLVPETAWFNAGN